MTIKLYLDYSSQPSRAVWAFILLNKIPCEITRSEEFAKINPMKKVPAIVDTKNGDFALAESHAIMRYLSKQYPCQDMWYPKNDHTRAAKIDEYLDFHHLGTRRCAYLIYNSTFAKSFGIGDPNFDPKNALKEVQQNLKFIDKILSKSSYIVGEHPSIADLSAFYEIQFLSILNYDFEKWKHLSRWMKYMSGIKQVNEANKNFHAFLPKLKELSAKLNKERPKL